MHCAVRRAYLHHRCCGVREARNDEHVSDFNVTLDFEFNQVAELRVFRSESPRHAQGHGGASGENRLRRRRSLKRSLARGTLHASKRTRDDEQHGVGPFP